MAQRFDQAGGRVVRRATGHLVFYRPDGRRMLATDPGADFPDVRDLDNSRFTCVTWKDGRFDCTTRPVVFNRVKPGEALIRD